MRPPKNTYLAVFDDDQCKALAVFDDAAITSTVLAAATEVSMREVRRRRLWHLWHILAVMGLLIAYGLGRRIHWKTRQPILAHIAARILIVMGDL